MGLDSYALAVPQEDFIDCFSFRGSEKCFSMAEDYSEEFREIFYSRKNYFIECWMSNLFRKKGGVKQFNCSFIQLTKEDLFAFKQYIKEEKDFEQEYTVQQAERLLSEAKIYLEEGKLVYYYSSW